MSIHPRRKGAFIVKFSIRLFLIGTVLMLAGRSASAHFKLLEPASWLIENDLGDPQKAGPCGGTNAYWASPATS